jgi:hypothetical protein
VTWRYHGLLIAALPAPLGAWSCSTISPEAIHLPDGRLVTIGGGESREPEDVANQSNYITEFRLENGLPIWHYEIDGVVLEKHVLFLVWPKHRSHQLSVTFRAKRCLP